MRSLAIAISLTLAGLAYADDVSPRVTAKDVIDRDAVVTASAIDETMRAEPVTAALSKCTVDTRMLGWVAFDKGKVTQVVVGGVIRAQEACVIGAIKKATFAIKSRVVATIEISAGLRSLLTSTDKIALGKFVAIKGDTIGGLGKGTGVGAGTGTVKGSGGGGSATGDFVTTGPISTGSAGGNVAIDPASGDFGGFTADEINRVIKARAGIFRACYQKELNRTPDIAGKIVVRFEIADDGSVRTVAVVAGSTTLKSDAVADCLKSNILRLKFPPKGRANVTYPFIFTQGG